MQKEILLTDLKLRDVNPVICGWEDCRPGHAFGPAVRFYWLLHYVVHGRGIFRSGEKSYPVRAGQFFVIRPFEVTQYQADEQEPWEYIWIGFTAGLPLPEKLQTASVFTSNRCGHIFSSLLEAEILKEGRELYLCGKIYQLLSQITQEESGDPDYVEQAKTYIESNYMKEISIQELARKLNLNRSYFSSLFRKKTGKSPQQYLTDHRMERACQLMTEYGYTPGQAALSTGYADIFCFSRMFRRHFGISPSEYCRQKTEEKASFSSLRQTERLK